MNELQRMLAGLKKEEDPMMSEEVMSQEVPEAVTDAQNAQSNEQATSPNMKTPEQLAQDQAQEEASRSVAGQMEQTQEVADIPTPEISPEMAKYKALMNKYEEVVNAKPKETTWQDMLPDALAGLHNIANYNAGSPTGNMSIGNLAKKQAAQSAAKKDKLSGLDKLSNSYKNYMALQNKGKEGNMTEYQKAQLKNAKDNRENRLDVANITAKSRAAAGGRKQSEGDKVIDREFGKKYTDWNTGGKADYEVNSKIFKEAIAGLEKKEVSTGFLSGIGSEVPGMRTDTRETEDKVRKAINGMLRATLGSQFTEKEGERIFRQTFDPYASEESNVERMNMELSKLEKRKDAMVDMGGYYRENKTMEGYEPSAIEETIPQASAPHGETVERNGNTYKWNPAVGKYQKLR